MGARLATVFFSFVVGALYGTLATTGHRHVWVIGEATIPWGLVLALVGVAALLVGLRVLVDRLASIAAAVGIIGGVALYTLPGLGGTVLITGDLVGMIWSIGPALIAVLIVAWPDLRTANVDPRRVD